MLKYVGSKEFLLGEKNSYKNINRSPFLVGRSTSADLVLTSLAISRQHCSFTNPAGREVWLIECLSLIGLTVDGQRLAQGEKKLLTDDALITLGENVHILFYPKLRKLRAHNRSVEIVGIIDVAPETLDTTARCSCNSSSGTTDPKLDDTKEAPMLVPEAGGELANNQRNLHELEAVEVKQHKEQPALANDTTKALGVGSAAFQSNISVEEKIKNLLQRLGETKKQVVGGERQISELTKELAVKVEELVKVQAETSEAAIVRGKAEEEAKNLQKQLGEMVTKIADVEQRNLSLQEEISKARAEVAKAKSRAETTLGETCIANNKHKKTEAELIEVKERNGCLQLEVSAHQAITAIKEDEIKKLKADLEAAMLTIADYKTSLRARAEEKRILGLEVANAHAHSSNLSADVAKYKRFWENSEVKVIATSQANVKLTQDLAALQLQNEAKRDISKELNSAKEEAKAEQIGAFEEFIETDLQCAICFELVIASTVLNCGHTFCSKCVREWQARTSDCPTCRVPTNAMQKCKMLDSFIARAANKLSEEFCERRREATGSRGTDSQGQPQRKKPRLPRVRGRQLNFNLPGPEPVPEAEFFVDLT